MRSLFDLLGTAAAGLWARPSRTLLILLGPIIGVGAIVAAIGLTESAKGDIRATLDELGRLGLQVQQGHVMALCHKGADEVADPSERDKLRASLLRDRLAH